MGRKKGEEGDKKDKGEEEREEKRQRKRGHLRRDTEPRLCNAEEDSNTVCPTIKGREGSERNLQTSSRQREKEWSAGDVRCAV